MCKKDAKNLPHIYPCPLTITFHILTLTEQNELSRLNLIAIKGKKVTLLLVLCTSSESYYRLALLMADLEQKNINVRVVDTTKKSKW